VRSLFVVFFHPSIRYPLDLSQILEEISIQDLIAIRPVESLDVGVLVRFARLDIPDLHGVFVTPIDERLS